MIYQPKTMRVFYTLIIAGLGGIFFYWLHLPVPWLLGPMLVVMLLGQFTSLTLDWHYRLRDLGLIIIGYTFGLTMTQETLQVVLGQLPYMIIFTTILVILCFFVAFFLSKLAQIDFQTAMLSSVPGGLSQILILAEELKGVDMTIVTVTQVLRVMMIVSLMPFIVLIPIFHDKTGASQVSNALDHVDFMSGRTILFISVALIFAIIFKKINFPTAYLLGPMFGIAFLQISWTTGPELPLTVTNLAQLFIGVHVGKLLNFRAIQDKRRVLLFAGLNGLILISMSLGLSFILSSLKPLSHATSLLSLAPGGADQMGVIAHAIQADLSLVSSYQVFRLFFIYFIIPPVMQYIFKHMKIERN